MSAVTPIAHPRFPHLPLVAAALVAGVATAALLELPTLLAAVAVALAAGGALLLPRHRRPSEALLALLAIAAILGLLRFHLGAAPTDSPLATLRGDHELTGTLRDDARLRGLFARVDLDVDSIDGIPVEGVGAVRVTLRAPLDPLRAGERVRMLVELEDPPAIADFDYAAYLSSRGIHAVGAFPDSFERLGGSLGGWRGALLALRRASTANIERVLPEPDAALAAGVLVGERGTMPDDLTEDLRTTGTTHLVVVSGQNVALLLGSAIAVFTMAIARRRAALLSLLLLPSYVVLIGGDPPVVRAAVMAVGIVIASFLGRRTPGWLYLVYAVALMLLWSPTLARDVAFQLSATATAGVIVVAPALTTLALHRLRWAEGTPRATLIELTATATAAALAVTPVQVAAFDRVSLVAIPANVLVAPLYEATVFVALLAATLGWFDPAAEALRPLVAFVPGAFVAAVDLLAEAPAAELPVRAPLLAGAAWYLALTAATWLAGRLTPPPSALEPAHHSGVARTTTFAVVAAGLWLGILQPAPTDATVSILDVGHGLAVLVEDGNHRVLIDTGPPDAAVLASLPRRVSHLDAVILSHSDADHVGGLDPLLRRLPVERLLATDRTLATLEAALPDLPTAVSALEPLDIGDRIRLTDRTTLEVLSPPTATGGRAHASDNDGSLVLRITIGTRAILITADIEAPAEAWLVDHAAPLAADVLLIPHHGSASSSTPTFLVAVHPAAAILSAGANNQFGHPHPEVIERYDPIPTFRTDHHGTVTITSDGTHLWIRTANEGDPAR